MTRYLHLAKGEFMSIATYSLGVIFTILGNIVYIVVIYFLWRSVYDGDAEQTIRGMTFDQVFVYMTLAGAIIILFKTWTDWIMSFNIREGTIIVQLIKPVNYQMKMLSEAFGRMLFNVMMITIPSIIMIFVIFGADIDIGWNLPFFILGVLLAFPMSFCLDFMVGLIAFYTESIWGVASTKEIMVGLFSGALIPLQFFPDHLQDILRLLPFQAIYHIPLSMATDTSLEVGDYAELIGIQVFWLVVLFGISHLAYTQAIKAITVNGG
jgi:ABC-2 type transport system permease protein